MVLLEAIVGLLIGAVWGIWKIFSYIFNQFEKCIQKIFPNVSDALIRTVSTLVVAAILIFFIIINGSDNRNDFADRDFDNLEVVVVLTIFVAICATPFVVHYIKKERYYKSEEFENVKKIIKPDVDDYNDLNDHIRKLKMTHIGIDQTDYGSGYYYDNSNWNYKREELKRQGRNVNVYQCSRSVCDAARRQPFKYVCKYFNIDATESNLRAFEEVLRNYETALEAQKYLRDKNSSAKSVINKYVPNYVKSDTKRLYYETRLHEIDKEEIEYPSYIFQYVSSGGNASLRFEEILTIDELYKFINYLDKKIKFNDSVQGQRLLMTKKLREEIKKRDNYTCKKCGNSIMKEPNLLLEIDHKKPLSKGGKTEMSNLQTLCWRCNRKKGAKYTES